METTQKVLNLFLCFLKFVQYEIQMFRYWKVTTILTLTNVHDKSE